MNGPVPTGFLKLVSPSWKIQVLYGVKLIARSASGDFSGILTVRSLIFYRPLRSMPETNDTA
jgi:hypothetical protein